MCACYNVYIVLTSNEHHAVMSAISPLHCSVPFRGPESSGSLSRTGAAMRCFEMGLILTQHQKCQKGLKEKPGDLNLFSFFLMEHPQPFNTIQYHSISFNIIQYHSISFNHIQSSLGPSKLCTTARKSSKTALRSAHALRSFSDPSWGDQTSWSDG